MNIEVMLRMYLVQINKRYNEHELILLRNAMQFSLLNERVKAQVTISLSDKTATRFVLSAAGFCFARESAELARIKALVSAIFDFHGREQLGN